MTARAPGDADLSQIHNAVTQIYVSNPEIKPARLPAPAVPGQWSLIPLAPDRFRKTAKHWWPADCASGTITEAAL
jgi:hypothetical protein